MISKMVICAFPGVVESGLRGKWFRRKLIRSALGGDEWRWLEIGAHVISHRQTSGTTAIVATQRLKVVVIVFTSFRPTMAVVPEV